MCYNGFTKTEEINMIHYFAVETKCGHVGKNKCIFIWFAVKAENRKDAAAKAREFKRVKHHHKDVIRQVKEISIEEYLQLYLANTNDPYLQCKNIQQQRTLENLDERIEADKYLLSKRDKPISYKDTSYLLKKSAIQIKDAIRQMQEEYYSSNIAV